MLQMSNSKNKVLVKELQKFFNKITALMLVSKDTANAPVPDMPVMFIVMKEQDFNDAKHYNINKTIETLLDDKYPVLHIKINEETFKVTYTLQDVESGLCFHLKTLDVTEPLAQFLKSTHYTEKIPMILMGQKADETFVVDEDIKSNIMLFIDGYFIE